MTQFEDISVLSNIDSLYRYAMLLSRNKATTEDLVQETYLRALAARERLKDDSHLKGWLFTILRNVWLNQLRKARGAPEIVALDIDSSISAQGKARDPHSLYAKKVECDIVRGAILQLPEESREIIVLREYDDLSYQEIASILRCPIGTVMSRLARARSKLRVLLSSTLVERKHECSPQCNVECRRCRGLRQVRISGRGRRRDTRGIASRDMAPPQVS